MHAILPLLAPTDFPRIRRGQLETLQVNVGYRCNQQCAHCHVNAGPRRTEEMTLETMEQIVGYLKASRPLCLDITGGAPELNPHFRRLVLAGRGLDIRIIDRCNLTILDEPGQEDLAEFLAENRVEVTASLPCYLEENVDRQRGRGVFERSIRALKKFNSLGYGTGESGFVLNLVYNPQGPALPPAQADLEAAYREHLSAQYGIVFDHLFTLANMPIQRFGSTLISKGQFAGYMRLLKDSFREANLDTVMCRSLLSVDWQGYVYDCDFNQMLGLPLRVNGQRRTHLTELMGVNLEGNAIVVRDHCYGCTAGQGSSCGGALGA